MQELGFPNALISTKPEYLSRSDVQHIINQAAWLRHLDTIKRDCLKPFHEDIYVGLAFCEPSTRTRLSTELAATKLGCRTFGISGAEGSSVMKGESGSDTSLCLDSYSADIIAMRHPNSQAIWKVAEWLENGKRLINCGNGADEHPTQALLDILMWMYVFNGLKPSTLPFDYGDFSLLEGRTIILCGDLLYGRTFGSGKWLLEMFGVKVIGVCPEALKPASVPHGLDWRWTENLDDAMDEADAVYMTRIQRERFKVESEYERYAGQYIITPELLKRHPNILKVLHPLPRVEGPKCEISPEVDSMREAGYPELMTCGLYARMAVILDMVGYRFV